MAVPTRRHHGRAARHRLEHGEPEALVQRRVENAAGTAVQGGELRVGDLADPAVDLDATPPASADDAQLDTGLARRLHRASEVLARLERRDRKDVLPVRARAVAGEDGVDAVRDHPNALRRDLRELDRLVAAELRDGDDRVRGAEDAYEPRAAVEPMPAREHLGRAEDGEIVHREHGRNRRANGPAERRAVQHVQRAGAASEADRVPEGITRHARRPPGPTERQQLELEARSIRGARSGARARGAPSLRASGRAARCRRRPSTQLPRCSADGVLGRVVDEERERLVEVAPSIAVVLGVERRLPLHRGVRRRRRGR